jgi:hypothetical protein
VLIATYDLFTGGYSEAIESSSIASRHETRSAARHSVGGSFEPRAAGIWRFDGCEPEGRFAGE